MTVAIDPPERRLRDRTLDTAGRQHRLGSHRAIVWSRMGGIHESAHDGLIQYNSRASGGCLLSRVIQPWPYWAGRGAHVLHKLCLYKPRGNEAVWLVRVFLRPALFLMNRLRYPQKFVLISLLFALPLALVMYLLISEINGGIEFAQKEIQGDRYLRPLRQLLEHVAHSRLLAHDYAGGRVSLRPELILLDLMMPEMDGFQFIEELRKQAAWRSIPIIVVTAKDVTEEDRLRLNGYVEKILQKGAYSGEALLA